MAMKAWIGLVMVGLLLAGCASTDTQSAEQPAGASGLITAHEFARGKTNGQIRPGQAVQLLGTVKAVDGRSIILEGLIFVDVDPSFAAYMRDAQPGDRVLLGAQYTGAIVRDGKTHSYLMHGVPVLERDWSPKMQEAVADIHGGTP